MTGNNLEPIEPTGTAPVRFSPIQEAVIIVSYDPAWPELFETERLLLEQILGAEVVEIEHIGSSSVPDLSAKNRVDILAGVKELDTLEHYFGKLQPVNYFLDSVWTHDAETGRDLPHFEVPEGEELIRMTFMKREPANYNLHIVEYGSAAWAQPIVFRDFLRANPQSLREYETLKQQLSQTAPTTREYTVQKSAFIQDILQQADSG